MEVPPEWLLLLFLPPLLSEAAYFTSLRDLIANKRPILQLAIGLVLATCLGIAYAVAWIVIAGYGIRVHRAVARARAAYELATAGAASRPAGAR